MLVDYSSVGNRYCVLNTIKYSTEHEILLALVRASEYGQVCIVNILLGEVNPYAHTDMVRMAANQAVQNGHKEIFVKLLGFLPSEEHKNCYTELAAEYGQLEILQHLIDHGIIGKEILNTTIRAALEYRHRDSAKILLAYGASIKGLEDQSQIPSYKSAALVYEGQL